MARRNLKLRHCIVSVAAVDGGPRKFGNKVDRFGRGFFEKETAATKEVLFLENGAGFSDCSVLIAIGRKEMFG